MSNSHDDRQSSAGESEHSTFAARDDAWSDDAVSRRPRWRLPAAIGAAAVVTATGVGVGVNAAVSASPSATNGTVTSSGLSIGDPGSSDFFGGGSGGYGSNGGDQSPVGSGASSGGATGGSGAPSDVQGVAAKVAPGLVDVNSTFSYQGGQGAGTGIVLSSNGEVLTNNHVIDGATKVSVTDVGNGKTYNASVVGYDPTHDLAVLQLQGASGLQTAKLGDSSKTAVGDPVVAVGNAGGRGGTPSSTGGSITALDRSITAGDEAGGSSEQLSGLIQVNANIQPGDSGGSLVNASGEVIGVDTAASQGSSLTSSGDQGFAIPINQALATAKAVEAGHGSSGVHLGPTAFLGAELSPSSNQSASLGYGGSDGGFGSSNASGAPLAGVLSGGPLAQAGLAAGDTITSIDGTTIDSSSTVGSTLIQHHPGDKVQVGWVDSSGQSHTTTVTLAGGPPA